MAKAETSASPQEPAETENDAAAGARNRLSLEDQIAKHEAKLRELKEQQREQLRKERERNIRAVNELIKSEKLDLISAEVWRAALPAIKTALGDLAGEPVEPIAGRKRTKTAP